MEDPGLLVHFCSTAGQVVQRINMEKIWQDGFLWNTFLFILTLMTCSYSLFGFLGSFTLLVSFLSGFFIFDKLFNVYKFTIPDLTKLLLLSRLSASEAQDSHARRQLIRQNTSDPGCRVCADINCVREQSPTHSTKPWEDLTIPANVNEALETLLIKLLDKYINSWYKNISNSDDSNINNFQTELKLTIRHAASILIHRVQKVDLPDFLLYRVLPLCTRHLNTVDKISPQDGRYSSRLGEQSIHRFNWHVALTNRNVELDYLRCMARQILPILLPASCHQCKTFHLLSRELLAGWILLPLSDAAADPTVLNTLLHYLLSTEQGARDDGYEKRDTGNANPGGKTVVSPLHDQHQKGNENQNEKEEGVEKDEAKVVEDQKDVMSHAESCSDRVKFLETFVPKTEDKSDLWHPSLETILKNQSLLFAFMQFLKTHLDINVLQFCLDVEEFNSRMLAPELSPEDLDILYKDAWDLYSIYFSAHSPDCIGFEPRLAQDLRKILSKDVSKLRTSTPLFKAYEYAYNKLERVHVGNFHKSEEFFTWLCGPKISSSSTNTSGLNSPESLDSPQKNKRSPVGPVAKLSNKFQKVTGVLKPNVVLEGQKDLLDSPSHGEIEIAETVKECDVVRDLSKWKVSVFNSRLKTNPNFTVKVVRTDLPFSDPDCEWSVFRKINDFYTLESKLTEFHGSFLDAQLPQKKLLTPCPDDSRIYESYLRNLLSKPELQGSDLLCAFLKDPSFEVEEFAFSRLFKKSVPAISLKKERGQNLEGFIRTFLDSTKTKATKLEWKDISEELKPRHVVNLKSRVFKNNLDLPPRDDFIDRVTLQYDTTATNNVYDGPTKCLLFLGIKSYKLSGSLLRLVFTILSVLKSSLDSLIHMIVSKLLNSFLSSSNLAYMVYLLDWSLFENTCVVDPIEMKHSVETSIENCSMFTRPVYRKIFQSLQDPLLNKQLFYHLLEEILAETFPELLHSMSPSQTPSLTSPVTA